jgi:hypothetical protein
MSCVNSNEQHHTIIAFFKHIGVVQVDGRTVVLIFNGVPIDRTISIHVRQGGKRKEGDEKSSMAPWSIYRVQERETEIFIRILQKRRHGLVPS